MDTNKIDAYSMIPGVLMATYFICISPVGTWCTLLTYILMCLVSMRLHLKKNDPVCDESTMQRYFRHDILAQQLALCVLVSYSPLGSSMVLLLLPFTTIIALSVIDIDMAVETNMSVVTYLSCFINCILASLAFDSTQRWRMMAEVLCTYIVFNIDKFYEKNKYTHGIFHILVHHVTYTAWSLLGVV